MARILVADDEPLVRQTMRSVLQRAGHEIFEAQDGDEALAGYRTLDPDLVLIDVIMPNREGVETIAALRKVNRRIPIVAMSGGGKTGSMLFLDLAVRMGANCALTKPVRNAELLQVINECLAEARVVEPECGEAEVSS